MIDPLEDDTPPPEELEMAVEETTGKPYPGPPEERIAALEKRIAYLRDQLSAMPDSPPVRSALQEAETQLAEWRAQDQGKN